MTQQSRAIDQVIRDLIERLNGERSAPLILGVSGAQGSGKSTLCAELAARLIALSAPPPLVTILSIDDLYSTRAERRQLGATVHPLCATRGLPGTHDVALGLDLLERFRRAQPDQTTLIPRFNKATDERVPQAQFDVVVGRPDLIIIEGWCVGARPGPTWRGPINEREARDDPDGRYYAWTEAALAGDYQTLWAAFDALLFIDTPSFETVVAGRCHQERRLAARQQHASANERVGVMSEAEVVAYVALFERLTRRMSRDLPQRATWVVPHWMTSHATGGTSVVSD
mgnify:CR=1 FL=1